jgi:DNA gyrase subunit A
VDVIGNIRPAGIVDQMQTAYLDYSMSVIVSRALPDVRDGLKPVHRRVLYAMERMGMQSNKSMRKSAGIVGEVLKDFHPHGDASVYDALVRMAQPWNMRYPLIQGQGNWGCFTGDTRIKLLDGTDRSFAELAQLPPDEIFHVYSVDATGRIVVGEGRHARLTRQSAELVEVTLDNGEKLRCTPNHPFMLRDGTYKDAEHLVAGDSLMPGYFDRTPVKEGLNPYLRIQQPQTGEFEFVHRLADEFNAERGLVAQTSGAFVRHHRNFNRFDNRPPNIQRMAFLEHLHLHAEHMQEMWSSPEFRSRQKAGVQRYYATHPEAVTAHRMRRIAFNKSPAFRAQNAIVARQRMRNLYATHPERRQEIAQKLRELWQDPEYRARITAALQGVEKRPLTKAERQRVSGIIAERSRAMWGNDAKREAIVAAISLAMARPEMRQYLSIRSQALWQDPAYRAKYAADHHQRMAQILWSKPETREMHRAKITHQRSDPAFRAAQQIGVQASNKRRLANDPAMMDRMAERSAASLHRLWHNAAYKRQVMRQKIAGYVAGLLSTMPHEMLTTEVYDAKRHSNWIPRWKKAGAYFDDFDELLELAAHYNHRVIAVRRLSETADVYDITVNEHHNFLLAGGVFVHNSPDDDPAAAMRYTEARMAAIASELLADIEKDTVDFKPNYDGHEMEPTVLPARLPNLLLNGAAGIAVGMATNIPPHNLRELCDGIAHLIDHPDATVEELMAFVKGPDFPMGGIIHGREGIRSAYLTGRGRVVVRARAHTEETEKGRVSIIVTELPYQINKAELVKKIAELARDKKIEGISDIRDESDRQGTRVVIDLKKDTRHLTVLNQLFKYTAMQSAFNANMLALVDGQPRVLNLKAILQHYVSYREIVIQRRTAFELRKARERAHILEGLQIALDHLDEVIETIRRSQSTETASRNLRDRFKLSEEQARAILDMRLGRLAALERKKVTDELAEVRIIITGLETILADVVEVRKLIKADLTELREKYGDPRRTEVQDDEAGDFTEEDLIPNDEMVVTLTEQNYIKRLASKTYRSQRRGGRGVTGMTTREDDTVLHLLITHAHDALLFFTNRGRVFRLATYELPEVGRQAKGEHIRNIIGIDTSEWVTAVVPVPKFQARDFLVMATRLGEVKKTVLDEFAVVRRMGLNAMDLEEGDELLGARLVHANDQVFLVTTHGQSIRFAVQDLRSASRASGGVRGIRLDDGDKVVSLDVAHKTGDLLVVTTHGYGKRTPVEEYSTQGRGGSGVLTARLTDKTGLIAGARVLTEDDRDLVLISANGVVIRSAIANIAQLSRATQGVRLMHLAENDQVQALATTIDEEDDLDETEEVAEDGSTGE